MCKMYKMLVVKLWQCSTTATIIKCDKSLSFDLSFMYPFRNQCSAARFHTFFVRHACSKFQKVQVRDTCTKEKKHPIPSLPSFSNGALLAWDRSCPIRKTAALPHSIAISSVKLINKSVLTATFS